MRRVVTGAGGIAALIVLLAATSAPVRAQDDASNPALTAVTASLEIEEALLGEDREAFVRLSRRRSSVEHRIDQLRAALDGAVANRDIRAPELLERIGSQLEQAEGERAELQIAERVLVDRIRDQLRRILLFEERVTALRGRTQDDAGVLDGAWEVVLLPTDQRGTFTLKQNGTLITGTYTLNGGFRGSLRGTLVKSKVYLERIDSRLGRSMDFEGQLSGDLMQIRGSWQSYELAEGEGANGQWSATRRLTE